jgi:hypothetical protein
MPYDRHDNEKIDRKVMDCRAKLGGTNIVVGGNTDAIAINKTKLDLMTVTQAVNLDDMESDIGAVSGLTTDEKDNLVGAVNELDTNTNDCQADATNASTFATTALLAIGTTSNLPNPPASLVEEINTLDVAVDSNTTKLDGIEASATADQTDAEIRTAVEAATDSNVFTDADHTKLNAIEAGADVTDSTNVVAALTAGENVTISAGGTIASTDTDTTYSSSDFTHDDLIGFVADEHIDWTGASAGTIHSSNYTDTDTTYTSSNFTHDDLTGFVADKHIDWTLTNIKNIHSSNYTDTVYDSTDIDAAVDLNTAKVTYPSADSTKVGYISVTEAINLDTLRDDVDSNDADIATNVTNISSNAADILTLQGNVNSNDADIANNVTNISNNDADIAALQSAVTSNDADIANNVTNISNNDADIAALQSAVTSNDTDIATNVTNITTNSDAIGTLSSLATSAKTNLVGAVNELHTELGSETTTSLVLSGNILTFTNQDGVTNTISLAHYLDDTDTNTFVSSGSVNSAGLVTFIMSDASTFTVNLESLLDTTVTVVDNLISTSTVDALSAGRGKVLKDGLDTLTTTKVATSSNQALVSATDAMTISDHTITLNRADGTTDTVTVPDNDTTYTVGDGGLTEINFTSADNTKLDGIAAGATVDQSAAEIKTLLEDGINSVHYVDGSIDTIHIGDDQVTVDKLANSINTTIAANTAKDTNVTTDLSVSRDGTKLVVVSSDGANATLPLVDTNNWGVMSDEMFDEHTTNNAKTGISPVQAAAITNNTTAISGNDTDIGTLASLTTTTKSNLVAAINELDSDMETVENTVDSHTAAIPANLSTRLSALEANAPKAFGRFTTVASPVLLGTSYNVTSVTRTATGQYSVVLDTDCTTANYTVMLSYEDSTATIQTVMANTIATTGFNIGLRDSSNAFSDASESVSFSIFENNG